MTIGLGPDEWHASEHAKEHVIRAFKLQFWLVTMDAIAFCGGYGTDLYLWAVHHASNNEEWFR